MHQVGNQPRLYYDAQSTTGNQPRYDAQSTNHQDFNNNSVRVKDVRFEFVTVLLLKIQVFWDVILCG
jgi:hypothetical protein